MAFAHLTLATRDVDGTCAFFAATLGWSRINRPANIGVPAAWLEIEPGQELHIIEVANFEPSNFEREYGRHVAFTYPSGQFEALQARLRDHGAEIVAPIRPTPFDRFFFRDPNGYYFEVIDAAYTPER